MPTDIISRDDARAKGLKRFYTGVACRNGHIAERHVKSEDCVPCRQAIDKRSYNKHQQKRIAKTARWRAENPEKEKEYRMSDAGRKAARRGVRKWRQANRDYCNAYRRSVIATDMGFRLRINLSGRINNAVRYVWGHKSARTLELLGCTIEKLRTHLERQFLRGMSWDNYGYGKDKWHIDHILACARFDLADPAEQRKCFHFTNLRPLWQQDNFSKNKRMTCLL